MGSSSNAKMTKPNELQINLNNDMNSNPNNKLNKNLKNKINKKSNNYLENVKSVYILRKKIFDIIPKNKQLGIIRYNKKLQKKLFFNINDYKEYSQLYISIEIEIKPNNSKYNNFINISEYDKEYYHIYFNDNKEEIKRIYLTEEDKVNKIKIKIEYQVKSFKELFNKCLCIKSICFKKFYRNNIIDMSYMFNECSSLKELNLSSFNTINVQYMKFMFYGCSSLKELNLSSFNTINVQYMNNMFYGCSSLRKLNLSNFNTINVISMKFIFNRCSSLQELNISNFNNINLRDNTEDINSMFFECSSLNNLLALKNKINQITLFDFD